MTIKKTLLSLFIFLLTSCGSANPSSKSEIQNHPSQQAKLSINPKPEKTKIGEVEEVKPLSIGVLKTPDKMDGCGIYFKTLKAGQETYWMTAGPYVFVNLEENNAVINIEGKNVELTLVTSNVNPDPNHHYKVGDKYMYVYKAGDIMVYLNYAVTELCDPAANYGTCEWVDTEGTMTIEQGNRKQTIKIKGGEGC